jgi:hypothetical protein
VTQVEYHWPKDAAPLSPAGKAYSWTNLISGQPQFLTNVTIYPTLQDVWDINSNGMAVGSVSVQEPFTWQRILFEADGTMDWFTPSERGLDAGSGTNSVTELRYYALLSTAAQFNNINDWRWLGPLSWGNSTAIALLVNDAGMIAGYGGVYTGNPTFDALRPTHAFRAPASGEFDGSAVILTNDLGVLPGGLHSFPRAMNQAGDLVGYSDFDVMNTGGLTYDPLNSHAVFWGLTNQTPEWLTNYPASFQAPYGYGDAFAINDSNQIVGASMTASSQPVGVLWQLNHNTNGVSSTTNTPFWEITDLNDRLTDPSWQVFRAVGINNDGLILAHAFNAAGEKHAVLLIPMAMAVDNNRDGQISLDGNDATTAGNPYRFWINDSQEHDDDESAIGADDQIPGSSPPNYSWNHAQGRSDYVNFFPVVLCLSNTLQMLPPSRGYEYHLSQVDGAVKFIYTDLMPTNAFDYITNSAAPNNYGAIADYNPSFSPDSSGAISFTTLDAADVVHVPSSASGLVLNINTNWLAQVQTNRGTGVILVEGCAATTQPLWLEIWRNGKLLGGTPLYLSIDGVEKMFRHLNLCAYGNGTVDPNNPSRYDAPNEPQAKKDLNFVFLHGYNVNQQEARGVLSEVFKRMYWSGSRAKFYGVTWNGAVSKNLTSDLPLEWQFTPNYHTNVFNAILTAPHLAEFLSNLSGETVVAAHSLGNMVMLSALNDCTNINFKVNAFFMIDAAVAMESVQTMNYNSHMMYSTWNMYANRLWASDWWKLFPADDDRNKLTWNGRFGNLRNIEIYNFYSSGEEVLREDDKDPPECVKHAVIAELVNHSRWGGGVPFGTYAWVWQEKGKGTCFHDWFIGSTHGGWRFPVNEYGDPSPVPAPIANNLPDSTLRQTPVFDFGSRFDQVAGPFPDLALLGSDGSVYAQANRDRILSDAIPALTLPVGANPVPALTAINRNFDMQKEFESGWPSVRFTSGEKNNNWHHSDFDYVAYPFTHKLFDQIVNNGNLK